jgi:hypothetical protein
LFAYSEFKGVDARDKPGHDVEIHFIAVTWDA